MAGLMEKVLADGNMTRTPYIACGMYKGYYVTVHMNQGFVIRINYRLPENADQNGFKNRAYSVLNQLRVAEKKVSETNVADHAVEIRLMPSNLAKNTIKTIDSVTDHLIGFLQSEGTGTGCQLCGSEFDVSSYNVNGAPHFLCAACAKQSMNQMEAERQSKLSDKSNPVLGIIGALIGSLIGVAIWVLIYQAGYIAGIAGVVIVLGAMKGYSILGKSLDKKGVVICVLISIIMIIAANEISLRLALYFAAKEEHMHLTFAEINKNWKRYMKNDEFKGAYLRDLLIGYLLAVFAAFGTIKQAFKSASGNYTMKKM